MKRLTLFVFFILLSCSKDSPIPDATDVPFYNKELDQWCEVQISKELDAGGNSFGRFVDVF